MLYQAEQILQLNHQHQKQAILSGFHVPRTVSTDIYRCRHRKSCSRGKGNLTICILIFDLALLLFCQIHQKEIIKQTKNRNADCPAIVRCFCPCRTFPMTHNQKNCEFAKFATPNLLSLCGSYAYFIPRQQGAGPLAHRCWGRWPWCKAIFWVAPLTPHALGGSEGSLLPSLASSARQEGRRWEAGVAQSICG